MILDDRSFDALTADDILALIPDVAEGRRLDYKASLPDVGEKGVRSFLNDVCAFANSAGGYLLYGVDESRDEETGAPTGVPYSVSGVGEVNEDETVRTWQQRITQSIEPAVIGHRIRFIAGFKDEAKVMAVFVPKSLFAPHRVNYQGKKDFYVRHDRSNLPMDIGEIRQAFVEAKELPQRIDELRRLRLSNILAGETPVELLDNSVVLACHLIPLSSFADDAAVDVAILSSHHMIHVLGCPAAHGRLNADGYLYRGGIGEDYHRCYAQVFRSGAIELAATVRDLTSRSDRGGMPMLPSQWQEKEYIRSVADSMELLKVLGVRPPVYIGLSLLRVRGVVMARPQRLWDRGEPIDKDVLVVPTVVSESMEEEPATLLRTAFDDVWQASGLPRSPYYDENGRWIGA